MKLNEHEISSEGFKVENRKVRAIQKKHRKVKYYKIIAVNYLSKIIENLAEKTAPVR